MKDRQFFDSSAAMARIQCATGCTTQTALAELLGIRQAFVSDAVRRGEIPADWLVLLLRLKGINPDWVLTGQGRMLLRPVCCVDTVTPPAAYARETEPPDE